MVKQCRVESGVSHFHLSTCITLKDVGSQHGCIRGFTEEPTVIQVSLNLQEDEIPANRKKGAKECICTVTYQRRRAGIKVRKESENSIATNPDKTQTLVDSRSLWLF